MGDCESLDYKAREGESSGSKEEVIRNYFREERGVKKKEGSAYDHLQDYS